MTFFLGEHPRFAIVHVTVRFVGQRHDQTQRDRRFIRRIGRTDIGQRRNETLIHLCIIQRRTQSTTEARCDEARRTRSQVNELANDIGVHALREIFEIQIDIIDGAIRLRRKVITQMLRMQTGIKVRTRGDEGASGLRHFGAIDRHITVDVQTRRCAMSRTMQDRRPKQPMKIHDVLADEVMHLSRTIRSQIRIKVQTLLLSQRLERTQVTNRRVEPHIDVLANGARNFETEVGRITADVPRTKTAFRIQPLAKLRLDRWNRNVTGQPLTQEFGELTDFKKIMIRRLQHRSRATHDGAGIFQFRRLIRRAAIFAIVTVLIQRTAIRTFALDVTVWQEHRLLRIKQLLNRTLRNVTR